MNKIERLIERLCPSGVEWKTLGEVCRIEKGKTPIQKAVPGEYPLVVTAAERRTSSTYQFEGASVIIPLVSARGHGVASLNQLHYQEGRFAVGNILCCVTPVDSSRVLARFLWYYLNHKKDCQLVPLMRGGANVSLSIDSIARVKVPLPPREIQDELVKTLLVFDEFGVLLTAELAKRKKQYEHYRDTLLSGDWPRVKLIDVLAQPITDGPHETPTFVEQGVPFISVEAVVGNRIDFAKKRGFISKEYDLQCGRKYKPQRNDLFVVKSGSTIGKVAMVDFDVDFNIWSPLAAIRVGDKCNPRYLFYLLQSDIVQDQIKVRCSKGSQPNIGMRALEQFEIPLPPLAEQERIVAILDKFDKLVNSLTEGLPAEIAGREKQYAYYRDRLLSFGKGI